MLKQIMKENGFKQSDIASLVGVTKAAVSAWNRNGVPAQHCPAIEVFTQGKVTRKMLRPNDWQKFWPELNG